MVICLIFLPFLGFFLGANQYKLYANPRIGKKKENNYQFWGLRRLHVEVVLVEKEENPRIGKKYNDNYRCWDTTFYRTNWQK